MKICTYVTAKFVICKENYTINFLQYILKYETDIKEKKKKS